MHRLSDRYRKKEGKEKRVRKERKVNVKLRHQAGKRSGKGICRCKEGGKEEETERDEESNENEEENTMKARASCLP